MRYNVNLTYGDTEMGYDSFEFDFEGELLDGILKVAKDDFDASVYDHEDLLGDGYKHLMLLNWISDWVEGRKMVFELNNAKTDKDCFDELIKNFNDSLKDNFKLEWVEKKEDNRKNLLDISEEEFINEINPFNDKFEFVFEEDYSRQLTVDEYLLDSSMAHNVLNLVEDDDIEIEKDRAFYYYQWINGVKTEENMKWFWFVLGDITGGFDSGRHKIFFI